MRILCLIAALLIWAVPAHAERRVALVIGNSAYEHVPQLANPKNDAADMAKKLQDLGFEVVFGEDLDLMGMRTVVREFVDKIDGAELSLFFYAGHGLQVNGSNYMAPTDAKLASYNHLDFEAFPMDLVLSAMERSTKVNLVFLDACRDNPLAENLARSMGTRSSAVGRGLAKLGSGVGSLIAFATQPGNVALDGDGRNSPFTTALLQHLGTPGQSVTDDLIQVRKEVLDATEGKQVPWDNSSLTGPVVLKEKPKEEPKVEPEPAPEAKAPTQSDNAVELAFWDSVRNSDDPRVLQTYLNRYPQGTFAELAGVQIEVLKTRRAQAEAEAEKQKAIETAKLEKPAPADAVEEEKIIPSDSTNPDVLDPKTQALYSLSDEEVCRLATRKDYIFRYWEPGWKQHVDEANRRNLTLEECRQILGDMAANSDDAPKTNSAETQIKTETAKLEQPAAPETVTHLAPVDPAELALATQKELARIGCLSGKADGKWGSGSERALKDYAGRQGIELASLQPSVEVLDRLKATTVRVCPLVCGKGFEEKNGRCEKVKREAKVEQKPETRSATTALAPPKAGTSKSKPEVNSLGQVTAKSGSGERDCYVCKQKGTTARICVKKGGQSPSIGTSDRSCKRL